MRVGDGNGGSCRDAEAVVAVRETEVDDGFGCCCCCCCWRIVIVVVLMVSESEGTSW